MFLHCFYISLFWLAEYRIDYEDGTGDSIKDTDIADIEIILMD